MKLTHMVELLRPQEELIAGFGDAKLVKTLDSKIELKGGSVEDRQEAREWMAMFWHARNALERE